MARLGSLTSHARVRLHIAQDPGARLAFGDVVKARAAGQAKSDQEWSRATVDVVVAYTPPHQHRIAILGLVKMKGRPSVRRGEIPGQRVNLGISKRRIRSRADHGGEPANGPAPTADRKYFRNTSWNIRWCSAGNLRKSLRNESAERTSLALLIPGRQFSQVG
jgi:hypothetical protein